jgi:hypothetical protein
LYQQDRDQGVKMTQITVRVWETIDALPLDLDYTGRSLEVVVDVARDMVTRFGKAVGAVVLVDGVEHTRILSHEVLDRVQAVTGVQLPEEGTEAYERVWEHHNAGY